MKRMIKPPKVERKWMFRGNDYYPSAKILFFLAVWCGFVYGVDQLWEYFDLPPLFYKGGLDDPRAYDYYPPEP